MSETYRVRVEKDQLVFSAGHFITFNGDVCERLHGHNYRVGAEMIGPLDENQYVVDFIFVRDTLKAIVDELDHRMLLPMRHPLIRVSADDHEALVTFRERRWIFPLGDCALLPVSNTTSELLARYIGQKLLTAMESKYGRRPSHLRIDVDECFGQIATWENHED